MSLESERVSGAPSVLLEAICESLERERVSEAPSVLVEAICESLERESEWGTFCACGGHV